MFDIRSLQLQPRRANLPSTELHPTLWTKRYTYRIGPSHVQQYICDEASLMNIIGGRVPGLVSKAWQQLAREGDRTMMTDRDRKTYWDLFETVCWICSRDEEKIAAIWGMSDQKKVGLVIAAMKVQRVIHSPPSPSGSTRGAVMGTVVPEANGLTVEAQDAFEDLLRKVHSRRVHMTAINCHDTHERQIEVPLAELNDLALKMIPDYGGVETGLWSQSRDALAWRSPQFLRTDVIGAWPAPRTRRDGSRCHSSPFVRDHDA